MRKYFLFIFLLCALAGYAQNNIQDKFFGCSWGSSMYWMRDALKSKNYSVFIENDNELNAYNIRFGGYDWKFANFYYFKDCLYSISFSSYFETKNEMYSWFGYMRDKLIGKYESYESIYINEEPGTQGLKSLYISDKDSDSVMLYCSHSRSNGGEMYYYLSLVYVYETLYKKAKNSDDNEL